MFNTLPANPYPPSSEQMNKGDNTELNTRVQALETSVTGILNGTSIDSFGNVETALATKANNEIIAPLFDETSGIYSVGDLVVYDGVLYQFTSAHETAGAWDISEVSAVKVSDELATLMSGLIDVNSNLTVSNGTITPQEGVTITSYHLQKSIKTVYLYMLVMFTPTLGTEQLLCVLPSGYRTQDRILFNGKNGTTGKLVACEVDRYGAVRVRPTSDDSTSVPTDFYLTITYFTS